MPSPAERNVPAARPPSPLTGWRLALPACGVALIAYPVVRRLCLLWDRDATYSHGFLVPALTAYMLYLRRRELARLAGASFDVRAPLLAVPGALLVFVGSWHGAALGPVGSGHLILQGVGLVLILLGFCRSVLGPLCMRRATGPLLFLLLALPLPIGFQEAWTLRLRGGMTVVAGACLRLLHFAVTREGNVLRLGETAIGVEEACSGIRSMGGFTVVAVAMVMVRRLPPGRALGLLAAVPVLAVIANLCRIVVAGVFAGTGHPALNTGWSHELVGLGTVAVGMAGLVWLGNRLSMRGTRAASPDEPPAADSACRAPVNDRVRRYLHAERWLLATLLVGTQALTATIERHYAAFLDGPRAAEAHRLPLRDFPTTLGTFATVATSALTPGVRQMLGADDELVRWYESPDGGRIEVTLIYWQPWWLQATRYAVPSTTAFPHAPDVCMPASGWTRRREYDRTESIPWLTSDPTHVYVFAKDHERLLLLHFRDSPPKARRSVGERARLLLAWDRPPPLHGRRYTLMIGVPITSTAADAEHIALSFARFSAPYLREYGIGPAPD